MPLCLSCHIDDKINRLLLVLLNRIELFSSRVSFNIVLSATDPITSVRFSRYIYVVEMRFLSER